MRGFDGGQAQLRIVIEPGDHNHINVGDLAMLQAAVARIRRHAPPVKIGVISRNAAALHRHLEDVVPLDFSDRLALGRPMRLTRTSRRLPSRGITRTRRRTHPSWADSYGEPLTPWLEQATLLMLTGAGSITDTFRDHALQTLTFVTRTRPIVSMIALMGHAIGPISAKSLRATAAKVLREMDRITLREGTFSPSILESLGLHDGFAVTGDDALEIAIPDHPPPLNGRRGIGISVRVSSYSGMTSGALAKLEMILQMISDTNRFTIVPLPMAWHGDEQDMREIAQLLPRSRADTLVGREITPSEIVSRLTRCRAVLAGSYHAGVFALAQGIPVLGIAANDYYRHKFLGLEGMFPGGVKLIDLREPLDPGRIRSVLTETFDLPITVSHVLMARAKEQRRDGDHAYAELLNRWAQRHVRDRKQDA